MPKAVLNSSGCYCLPPNQMVSGVCTNGCPPDPNMDPMTATPNCACLAPYIWNTTNNNCSLNCPDYAHTDYSYWSQAGNCTCRTNYFWDPTTKSCKPDCSRIPFSNGTNVDPYTCGCLAGYYFNSTLESCALNCSNYDNTTGGIYGINATAC